MPTRLLIWGASLWIAACGVSEPSELLPGKLAVVGSTVLGPEDLSGVQAQLGAYAQLRFQDTEGRVVLLESLVAAELMALEAIDAGLGDDPRVHWALLEEQATLYLTEQLERRVPRAEFAAQRDALRARYDAHPEMFWLPEQRNLEGVVFDRYDHAEDALQRLQASHTTLAELGPIVATPLQSRDDHEHPGFHPILFDPTRQAGDWLSAPVVIAGKLIVGRIQQRVESQRRPFDDPQVQEQLVQAIRAPALEAARADLLAHLPPLEPPSTPSP